jgi:hypothetical protein
MGRSRGGLTSKIHALVDRRGRPVNLRLTGGQVADCSEADALTEELGEGKVHDIVGLYMSPGRSCFPSPFSRGRMLVNADTGRIDHDDIAIISLGNSLKKPVPDTSFPPPTKRL